MSNNEYVPVQIDAAETADLEKLHARICELLAKETDPRQAIAGIRNLAFCCVRLGRKLPPVRQAAPLVDFTDVDFAAINAELEAQEEAEMQAARLTAAYFCAKEKAEAACQEFGFGSPEHAAATVEMLMCVPQADRLQLFAKAVELGLLPPPSGYTSDGEPVFEVRQLGAHFGVDAATATQLATPDLTLSASEVHRVH